MIWLAIIYTLLFFYGCIIFFYLIQWKKSKEFFLLNDDECKTSFSIIIPARNEAQNITALLKSITQNKYPSPLFEIIVIDDHSIDQTYALVADFIKTSFFNITIIKLEADSINSYKKKAIETGIAQAKNEWIICTDADCVVPPNWLAIYDQMIQKNKPQFIAAPVVLTAENTILNVFQNLDFITLQGITAASVFSKTHNMCNGANVAYTQKAFNAVDGFKGIDHIASGDDLLLMHKIDKAFPGQIFYLKSKEAIVETLPPNTWKAFLNQRIRWASKSTQYEDKKMTGVLLIVYLLNLGIFITGILSIFKGGYFSHFFIFIFLKTLIEFPFVYRVASFFARAGFMIWFLFFQPIHITYTIIAGFLGVFGTYQWKGRTVK